jgi:hypothetical protein
LIVFDSGGSTGVLLLLCLTYPLWASKLASELEERAERELRKRQQLRAQYTDEENGQDYYETDQGADHEGLAPSQGIN